MSGSVNGGRAEQTSDLRDTGTGRHPPSLGADLLLWTPRHFYTYQRLVCITSEYLLVLTTGCSLQQSFR